LGLRVQRGDHLVQVGDVVQVQLAHQRAVIVKTPRERRGGDTSPILDRIRPRAGPASTWPRRSPPIRAPIIARPDTVPLLEATESSVIPAPGRAPPSRGASAARCWAILRR